MVRSRDGRVYQMGSTGALNAREPGCAWEGALVPTRVSAFPHWHGRVHGSLRSQRCCQFLGSREARVCHAPSESCSMAPFAEGADHAASIPQVDGNLFGLFVEEVACGMHHVVVAASRVQVCGLETSATAGPLMPQLFPSNNFLMRRVPLRTITEASERIKPCPAHHRSLILDALQANGHIPEDHRRIRILAWGRGSEGQLGTDTAGSMSAEGSLAQRIPQDYNHPQVLRLVAASRL